MTFISSIFDRFSARNGSDDVRAQPKPSGTGSAPEGPESFAVKFGPLVGSRLQEVWWEAFQSIGYLHMAMASEDGYAMLRAIERIAAAHNVAASRTVEFLKQDATWQQQLFPQFGANGDGLSKSGAGSIPPPQPGVAYRLFPPTPGRALGMPHWVTHWVSTRPEQGRALTAAIEAWCDQDLRLKVLLLTEWHCAYLESYFGAGLARELADVWSRVHEMGCLLWEIGQACDPERLWRAARDGRLAMERAVATTTQLLDNPKARAEWMPRFAARSELGFRSAQSPDLPEFPTMPIRWRELPPWARIWSAANPANAQEFGDAAEQCWKCAIENRRYFLVLCHEQRLAREFDGRVAAQLAKEWRRHFVATTAVDLAVESSSGEALCRAIDELTKVEQSVIEATIHFLEDRSNDAWGSTRPANRDRAAPARSVPLFPVARVQLPLDQRWFHDWSRANADASEALRRRAWDLFAGRGTLDAYLASRGLKAGTQ